MVKLGAQFKKEILKLKNRSHVNKEIFQQFLKRLNSGYLIETENPADHYCSFLVPVDTKTKSIFVGHHIDADQWIPPGGHIEEKESPVQTVYREFSEELSYKLTKETVALFDLGIIKITNPERICRIHYDFWYLVSIEKIDFNYNKNEFYQATWLPIDVAIKKATKGSIVKSLSHLKRHLEL
ncbi:NUDIX hydrolase [Candidatus Roizmanbacteria bacterium]|nr:NUDIX hydrolase [Candidatus Roizmanbacteria bacterium]